MSKPSDYFHSEMDYLWHAVGEAQDASARAEEEKTRARTGLEQTASRLRRLEAELAESRLREIQFKNEAQNLKQTLARDSAALDGALRASREAAALEGSLRERENAAALHDAETGIMKAEAASLRKALETREGIINGLKEKISGLFALPELSRAVAEDALLSGKPASAYERLVEQALNGASSAKLAAEKLALAQEEGEKTRAALTSAEGELSDLRSALENKRRELAAIEASLAEAANRGRVSAEEKYALEGRAGALGRALAEKETALESALSDCAALKTALETARFEAGRLRQAADEQAVNTAQQRANFSGAVAQVFDLQKKAAALRSELAGAKEENAALSAELEQRGADIEKVNALLKEAKGDLRTEKELSRKAGTKIRSLQEELEALKTRIGEAGDYSARLLRAVEERELLISGLKNDLKKVESLELENEELKRKNIKFSGFLKKEQADFNGRMIGALEKAARDLKTFNLRISAAERKGLEPAMQSLLASVNLLKSWQEYLDPETPEFEEVELAAFTAGETGKWDRAFKQKKLSIRAEIVSPRLRARLAPEKVKMLFYQLIKNAYERLPRGGSLRVALKGSDDGRQAILSFEDTGPGFTRETLEKAFAPFNTTDKGKAGIGLAVARRIAEKHGGTLEISNGAERGALAEVRLPLGG